MSAPLDTFRRRPVVTTIFLVAVFLMLFFGARLTLRTLAWHDPALRDAPLEPWMTPRYVVHARDVPRDVVGEALGLEPGGGPRVTIEDIARQEGIPVEDVIARVEAAIADYREAGDD